MALLLNIDTSLDTASVCLSSDKGILAFAENKEQRDHAAWLHQAIANLFSEATIAIKDLEAVAVSIGPGSYTGLRVGLSAAKGLCYALNLPLIAVDTLQLIAFAAKDEATSLICPVIDARRMEVYAAVYDKAWKLVVAPCNMIVEPGSFSELLDAGEVLFCGNGRKKLQKTVTHPNARFSETEMNATHLSSIAAKFYEEKKFADLAYLEPFYLKEFYTVPRKDS